MTDTDLPRRRVLAAVGSAGAVAGCSALTDDGSSGEGTADDGETETPATTATDAERAEPEPRIAGLTADPADAAQTDTVIVTLTVANDGDGEFAGELAIAGSNGVPTSAPVTIAPGDTETLTVERELMRAGEQSVRAAVLRDGDAVVRDEVSVTVRPSPSSFVGVEGSSFELRGDPLCYSGGHAIGNMLVPRTSTEAFEYDYSDAYDGAHYVEDTLRYASDLGLTVLRTYAYNPPWSDESPPTHAAPGEFNEQWFRHFDRVIAAAKRNGVRLVVPLMNHVEIQPPGPVPYAEWSDTVEGDGMTTRELNDAFFDDERANRYYEEYIEYVLTRENHLTGVEYRNDPTIMLWECGNEIEYHTADRRGDSLASWYDRVASFIKSVDDNHLVGTGMYGSDERNDFVADHRSDAIDACSFHLYPKQANWSDLQAEPYGEAEPWNDMSVEETTAYIRGKVETARDELDKPAYLGEFGIPEFPEIYGWDLALRNRFFEAVYETAAEIDLGGVNAFDLALNRKYTGEVNITDGRETIAIYPDDGTCSLVESYSRTVADKRE